MKHGTAIRIATLVFVALAFPRSAICGKPERSGQKPKTQIIGDRPQAESAATFADAANPKSIFVSMPPPRYPLEARRRRETGRGLMRIDIDETGKVTGVKVFQSTGHQLLDEEGVNAFRKWRARPGPPLSVYVPVIFTMWDQDEIRGRSELSPYLKQTIRSAESKP